MIDPGGNNLTGDDYQALFKVWRDQALTVRVAYTLVRADDPARSSTSSKRLTALLPMGFGDDMLRFNGLGERITGGDEQQRQARRRPTRTSTTGSRCGPPSAA